MIGELVETSQYGQFFTIIAVIESNLQKFEIYYTIMNYYML